MNEKAVQHGLDTGISGFFTWRTALGGLQNCNRFIASALRAPQKSELPQNCELWKTANCGKLPTALTLRRKGAKRSVRVDVFAEIRRRIFLDSRLPASSRCCA